MSVLLKNPGDDIDYTMTWSNLGAATVSSVVHSVPTGLTIVSESNTMTTSTVRLSGATHGRTYSVKGTATLNTGRTLVRTFPLRVMNA
jgi:uncharacterized repeat protein (TIGR01451 family)